jgi:formamidopyrimidine-DNA glycosylase
MAVHGRFGQPCPVCGTSIRRIVYADNECDYCPVCQTEGRILADRSLSRLLKDDWPRRVEETDQAL